MAKARDAYTHMDTDVESSSSEYDSSDDDEDEVELVGLPDSVAFTMDEFENEQGLNLKTYRFEPRSKPLKGRVFLCHGYAAHTTFEWLLPSSPGEKHNSWKGCILESLTEAGYDVHALDHQSHGRSEGASGVRCYFNDFDDLPKEAIAYVRSRMLSEGSQRMPLFVLGISMGGATAVRMVQMEPSLFSGAVLYAPMLSLQLVRKQKIACCITNGHLEPMANCLSACVPYLPIAKPARNLIHPKSQQEMDEDTLTYSADCRARVGKCFMDTTNSFMNGSLSSVETAFITFHGQQDTFTDPAGSEKLFELAKSSDKTYLKVGPGFDVDVNIWHAMTTEPGHEEVFKRTLAWLNRRC